ncbi:hypothetical protein BCBMB205_06350 [Bacillus sp. CN2]|nr:hypothetical protein BCBMB205_06350 [Bacillus velezensis]ARZ56961.1 hypothetical protein BAGQ_0706 [Bacillus velezensis]GFR57142.1 hypothetical protein BCBMB205_06350 [Bacillus sp. CN2]
MVNGMFLFHPGTFCCTDEKKCHIFLHHFQLPVAFMIE